MPHKVALFAAHDDAQIKEIADAVLQEGGRPLVLDIQAGGMRRNPLEISDTGGSWNGADFSDVRAMHIRGTAPRTLPALPPVLNAASHAGFRARFLEEQEFQAATYAFFESQVSQGKLVVNPLTGAYVDHNSKAQFYEKLRAGGYPVPRSLSTNSPDKARKFITDVGEAVVKPAIGVGSTRLVTEQDAERLDELRPCPALFQERIHGRTLRVHIVGDTVVLALRIITDGGVDSRSGEQYFEFIKLGREDETRICEANRMLGLHYAAWDVIEGNEGSIKYLDCNPGPYIMWIGPAFRGHVFRQLAAYLVSFAETGSLNRAARRVEAWNEG